MYISVLDIFKVGIGPSSSHTMGPMIAANRFVERLTSIESELGQKSNRIEVRLHGSLAFTGKGHGTDRAVILGLCGYSPHSINLAAAEITEEEVRTTGIFSLPDQRSCLFRPESDLIFDYGPSLPGHSNGLTFTAFDAHDLPFAHQVYYSVGGGFVLTAEELTMGRDNVALQHVSTIPYPFQSAADMLHMSLDYGQSIAQMKRANEIASGVGQLDEKLDQIWLAMKSCIDRGLAGDGVLPGGLKVRRRAGAIHAQLQQENLSNTASAYLVNDWLMVYAMAVNEENAAGGKVVTAPTNGAAGVIPAVIRHYVEHCAGASHDGVRTFLLVSAAIGGLIKQNASISGAEVGCQGEIGSAAAMAAAGFCAVLGGTSHQIENAAEIALEHHLGLTCDPAGGLVQVPCIERNGLGAVKAVTAARLALRGNGTHFMPLDNCIETMRQTGADMSTKYKETSQGGLAVNILEC